jgi:hypothetical protein
MYAPFVITSIVEDNPVGDKIDTHNVQLLEQLLNAQIQLSNYGTGLSCITVVFIGTTPEDLIHQETFTYDAEKKELYAQLRLPYAVLEQGTEAAVLGLMARRYLNTLQGLPLEVQAQIADFDWVKLAKDVEALFLDAIYLQE